MNDVWGDPFERNPGDWPPYKEPTLFERILEHTLAELATHTVQACIQVVQEKLGERSTLTQRIIALENKVDFMINELEFIDHDGESIEKPDIVPKPKRAPRKKEVNDRTE